MQIVDNFLVRRLNAQQLQYAAGQAICCPACGEIMDCRRTVLAELLRTVGKREEESMAVYTMCVKCWDQKKSIFTQGIEKAHAKAKSAGISMTVRLDVIDGREYAEELE